MSYYGCANVEWIDLPQKAEAPPQHSVSEFWAEQIESTDPDENGNRVYIFRNPATERKTDAVGQCSDTGPETRENEGNTELKIVQTTAGKVTSFSISCKKPPVTG
jgi:hypothetical protein